MQPWNRDEAAADQVTASYPRTIVKWSYLQECVVEMPWKAQPRPPRRPAAAMWRRGLGSRLSRCVGIAALAAMLVPPAARAQAQDPSTIVGLKLKNRPSSDRNTSKSEGNWRSVAFETGDLSYRDFCRAMKAKGANAITLRIAGSLSEFEGGATFAALYDEVAAFVAAAHAEKMPVHLWERRWFSRNKEGDLITDLTGIVARTDRAGTTPAIAGVILTETHLTDGREIRERAVAFARLVNRSPGLTDFLKTRTYVFPGAELGADFRDIRRGIAGDADYRAFYTRMAAETGYFAWSFKHFGDFTKTPAYRSATREAKSAYLRADTGLGLDALATLVDWGRGHGFARHAHVIFWGDDADTVANMDESERWAVKDALVTRGRWPGRFFNLAIAKRGETRYLLDRKAIFYNTGGATYAGPGQIMPNDGPDPAGKGPGKLFSAWANWGR